MALRPQVRCPKCGAAPGHIRVPNRVRLLAVALIRSGAVSTEDELVTCRCQFRTRGGQQCTETFSISWGAVARARKAPPPADRRSA